MSVRWQASSPTTRGLTIGWARRCRKDRIKLRDRIKAPTLDLKIAPETRNRKGSLNRPGISRTDSVRGMS